MEGRFLFVEIEGLGSVMGRDWDGGLLFKRFLGVRMGEVRGKLKDIALQLRMSSVAWKVFRRPQVECVAIGAGIWQ